MVDDSTQVDAKFKIGDVVYVPHNKVIYECTLVSIKKHHSGRIIYGSKKDSSRTFYGDEKTTLTKEESEIVKRSWDCLL